MFFPFFSGQLGLIDRGRFLARKAFIRVMEIEMWTSGFKFYSLALGAQAKLGLTKRGRLLNPRCALWNCDQRIILFKRTCHFGWTYH